MSAAALAEVPLTSSALSVQPLEPSVVPTMMSPLVVLYNSTNSSFAPTGPRRRNSLMITSPGLTGCEVSAALAVKFADWSLLRFGNGRLAGVQL